MTCHYCLDRRSSGLMCPSCRERSEEENRQADELVKTPGLVAQALVRIYDDLSKGDPSTRPSRDIAIIIAAHRIIQKGISDVQR